jgi:deoxyadenosine/deoxycytidine kinase
MSEQIRISTIEGNCYSGKSTMVRELGMRYGMKTVGENADFANNGKDFPIFPPASYEDAKKSIDLFVQIEKKRYDTAVNLAHQTSQPVVMDRSPLSCIIFQAAVEVQFNNPSAYAYSVDAFNKEVQDGKIVYPQALVYLEPETIYIFKKRVIERGRVAIDFLNTTENFLVMKKLYSEFISRHYRKESTILLKSQEGNIDLDTYTAFQFITNANYSSLERFQHLDIHSLFNENK